MFFKSNETKKETRHRKGERRSLRIVSFLMIILVIFNLITILASIKDGKYFICILNIFLLYINFNNLRNMLGNLNWIRLESEDLANIDSN